MTYESTELPAQIQTELNNVRAEAQAKAAAEARKESSYHYGGVEGYGLGDYDTWK